MTDVEQLAEAWSDIKKQIEAELAFLRRYSAAAEIVEGEPSKPTKLLRDSQHLLLRILDTMAFAEKIKTKN